MKIKKINKSVTYRTKRKILRTEKKDPRMRSAFANEIIDRRSRVTRDLSEKVAVPKRNCRRRKNLRLVWKKERETKESRGIEGRIVTFSRRCFRACVRESPCGRSARIIAKVLESFAVASGGGGGRDPAASHDFCKKKKTVEKQKKKTSTTGGALGSRSAGPARGGSARGRGRERGERGRSTCGQLAKPPSILVCPDVNLCEWPWLPVCAPLFAGPAEVTRDGRTRRRVHREPAKSAEGVNFCSKRRNENWKTTTTESSSS